MASDNFKTWYFDVEMIIDHEIRMIRGEAVRVCTHRIIRSLSTKDLIKLINDNNVFLETKDKITLNIRGETIL